MISKNRYYSALNALKLSKNSFQNALAFFATVWGVISAILGNYTLLVLIVSTIAMLICDITIFIISIKQIHKGFFPVHLHNINGNVELQVNDYQVNMEHYIHNCLDNNQTNKLKDTAFVMGIDLSGDKSTFTKSGIVHDVLAYLKANYKCSSGLDVDDEVQQLLDKERGRIARERIKQLTTEMKNRDLDIEWKARLSSFLQDPDWGKSFIFGDCINLTIDLIYHDPTSNKQIPFSINLVFVVNSGKRYGYSNLKEEVIGKNHGKEIVPTVFNYLERLREIKTVMIGAMGTNGENQNYSVIVAQTINEFVRVIVEDPKTKLEDLILSIRESDYSKESSFKQLADYLDTCSKFY